MKGLKYIAVLLLVNIGIMIGHNLVPHHHHVSSYPSNSECPETHECPVSSGNHQDEGSDPGYCHAFNNIVFVKYSQSQIPIPGKLASFLLLPGANSVSEPNTGPASTPVYFLRLPMLSPELAGMLSLRGPPVLS